MRRAALLAVVALAVCVPGAAALPVITPKLFGTAGDNGWYRSNVTVNWTVVDDQGLPIISTEGCDPSTVTNDTPPTGTKLTCSATSQIDPMTTVKRSGSVIVLIDRLAPGALTAAADSPDNGGWFNHPVRVSWAGTDAGSGIASCTSTPYSGPDATGITLTGTCRDKAGNVSAPLPFVLNYDTTAPVLSSVTAIPDDAGARLAWQATGAARVMVMRSAPAARASGSSVVYDGAGDAFTDRGLKNGRRYTYVVQALDAAGNAASSSVAVTPDAEASTKHLLSPGSKSILHRPPLLRWRKIARASYYNVQLFRNGKKLLSAWPTKPQYQLRSKWRYRGKRHRLVPGTYRWLLWAGYGKRSEHRYGKLLGRRTFVIR
jgi:hypothetical protein